MGTKQKPAKRKHRWLIWLFELLIIFAIVFAFRGWQQRALVSGEAPLFDEITLQGKEISLETYKGKPVLLHFWASWCGTCEFEQPGISKVEKDWPLITIAYNSGETEAVKRYMERKDISHWTTVVDNDGELTQQYGVIAVPTSLVLDSKGQIRFSEVGFTSSWGLHSRLWLTEKLTDLGIW